MNELMHYGVLGMKWGHHKVRDASNKKKTEWNKNYSKSDRNIDTMIFGKSGVKRINKRMNKGQSYLKAESIEAGQYMVKSSLLSPLLVPAQIILLAPADTWSTKISVMKLLVNTLLLVAVLL